MSTAGKLPNLFHEQTFLLSNAAETFELGRQIGLSLATNEVDALLQPANFERVTLALCGELGAGKTTFVKGFGVGLGIQDPNLISSPTFTYVNIYDGVKTLYHFDLYRLKSSQEFLDSGFMELLENGIACIEWPESALPFLPSDTYFLTFTHVNLTTRRVTIAHEMGHTTAT